MNYLFKQTYEVLQALFDYIENWVYNKIGVAGGLATLNEDGKVPSEQIDLESIVPAMTQEEASAGVEEAQRTISPEVLATAVDEKVSPLDERVSAAEGNIQTLDETAADLNERLETVEQLAEISIGGGDIGIATAADFDNPTPEQRAKVPTVGAVLDGISEGVFDLTAKTGDSYATLADALTAANTTIPTNKKKGGMSIKYVLSSDNKYVQYFLPKDEWSANVADWEKMNLEEEVSQLEAEVDEKARIVSLVGQGNTGVNTGLSGLEGGHSYRIWIDSWNTDQLTSTWSNLSFYVRYDNNGSYVYLYTISVPVTLPNYADITLPDNVTSIEIGGRINSGATARVRLDDITALQQGGDVRRKVNSPIANRLINTSNSTITSTSASSGNYCLFIPVREGEQYMIRGEGNNSSVTRLFALYTYDSIGNNYVRGLTFTSYGDFRLSPRYVVIPNGVTHLAINFANYNSDTDGVWLINGKDERLLPFWEFEFGGMGNYGRPTNLNDLMVKGHTYRLMPNGAWDTAGVTSPNTILGVYIDMSTRISNKITIGGQRLSKFYDFTIPKDLDLSTHSVDVSCRATFGFRASFFLQDITAQEVELFPLSGADGAMATFMDAVQRKSDNIGLTSSTWNNPYGGRLYGFNRTTVKDLLKATIYSAGNPRLMDIMGATETKVRVWGEHARVVTITNDIPTQLATYYQTLHGTTMPYKILANKAGAHANESDLADNGFSLLVIAIVSGHYVAAVVGIGNTSQGYTSGRNNRVKGMIELLDIVKAHYDGMDTSGMSVVSCEKAIASELPSNVFPQCYRKDAITPIHSQDADTIFMPASTSKVMAAITMVDFLEMGDFYRITDNEDELVNDSNYTAYAGDVQSVETSFYAMLMASNGANALSLARIAGEKILNQTTSLV